MTSVRGGGAFAALKLEYFHEEDDKYGHVVEIVLDYVPGSTSEQYGYVCNFPGGGQIKQPVLTFPAWSAAFVAVHLDELGAGSSEGAFTSIDWEIFGDEYFAKKEWIKEAGEIVEAGTFKLYHTPGE